MTFFQKYKWLIPMQLFIGMLLVARVVLTHSIMLLFLPWNLFLAVIPLYLSYRLTLTNRTWKAALYIAGWLLFFPNALYIITDIFHLGEQTGVPLWFDLLILFSSAMSGVIVGLLSMQHVEQYLYRRISNTSLERFVFGCFILCGYGIYLGRYLRWNSWDIVMQPCSLLMDIKQDVLHPVRNYECWLITLLFGVWMYILYGYFKKMRYAG